MLAKNWKRIGLIILIIACFADITSKLVKKVSFNDNVKSTITNTVTAVDSTIENVVTSTFSGSENTAEEGTTVENTQTESTLNAPSNITIIEQGTN